MSSSLSDRIKDRMAATGLTNAQLASAAGVKQPTSFNWGSGKTKNIKGEPLLLAAKALGVTPEWLSTGKGPKLRDLSFDPPEQGNAPIVASDHIGQFKVVHASLARAHALLDKLPEAAVEEAILQMEWLMEKHKKSDGSNGKGDPLPKRGKS